METKKIVILKPCVVDKKKAKVNDTFEVKKDIANYLISCRLAKEETPKSGGTK